MCFAQDINIIYTYIEGSAKLISIFNERVPDMRIPIQFALTYPERLPSPAKRLSLFDVGTMTFEKVAMKQKWKSGRIEKNAIFSSGSVCRGRWIELGFRADRKI